MGTALIQGDLWSARAHEWADLHEQAFLPLYTAAFDAAHVSARSILLDVGCGSGLALTVAAQRGAKVSGLDAAPALIAIAQSRLPAADLRTGELEELPFPDGTFDVVTGFNSFQYAGDRVHALVEARRVTKPGGNVVAAVWGDVEKCEMAGYFAAIGKLLPAPPPGAPGPWALSPPGALEALAEQAGLKPSKAANVTAFFHFPDDETAVRALLAAGPSVRALRHSGEDKTKAAVTDAIRPFRKANGSYTLKNDFRYLVASA